VDELKRALDAASSSSKGADDAREAQLATLKSDLAKLKQQLSQAETAHEEELESAKTDLENVKVALEEAEEAQKKAEKAAAKELALLQAELAQARSELTNAQRAAAAATEASATAASASGAANDQELARLVTERDELSEAKSKLAEQLEMANIELSDLKQEMDARVDALEDKLLDAEKKAKKALKEKEAEVAELTKQLKQAKAAAATASSRGDDDDDDHAEALKRAEAISTELQNQIEAKDEELQELTDENTTLKKEVRGLKEAVKRAQEESGDNSVSQEDFDSLKQDFEALKTELQEEKLIRAQVEESSNQELAKLAKKKKAKIALLKEQIQTLSAGGTVAQTNGKRKNKGDDNEDGYNSDTSSESSSPPSSAIEAERRRNAVLSRKRDELEKLVSTVYAVREIASCAELEPQLQEMVDWLSENDYFSAQPSGASEEDEEDMDDKVDFLESVASAIQRQALVAQNVNSLFAWVGQIGLVREAVVSKHGAEGDDEEDNTTRTTQAFVSAIEEATLAVYTALVNVAYNKLRPLCVAAFLAQKKPEMRKLLKFLSGAVAHAQRIRVHEVVLEQVLCQIFYFINCCVFNKMLEDKNPYCTPSNSFEIKLALSQLEEWVQLHIPKSSDKLHEQMAHTYEAATMLSMDKKMLIDDLELRRQIIPSLNPGQVYTLVKNFKPDSIAPDRVSDASLKKLKTAADSDGHDILLDPEARS
jgi:myosin heavy subunit